MQPALPTQTIKNAIKKERTSLSFFYCQNHTTASAKYFFTQGIATSLVKGAS